MEELLRRFTSSPALQAISSRAAAGLNTVVAGAPESVRSLLAGWLALETQRPTLLVCPVGHDQNSIGEVRDFWPQIAAYRFRPSDPDSVTQLQSLTVSPAPCVIVTDRESLLAPAPILTAAARFALSVGLELAPDRLIVWLEENGYQRTDLVTEPGEYAARGGIVDAFSEGSDAPLRIEFDADHVSSLRFFDSLSQLSRSTVNSAELVTRRLAEHSDLPASTLLPRDIIALSEGEPVECATLVTFSDSDADVDLGFRPASVYLGNLALLRAELDSSAADWFIVCSSEYHCERLASLLGSKPHYLFAGLDSGFASESGNWIVLTEREIYGSTTHRPARRRFKGLPVDNLVALRPGDYVVHVDYGIGVFAGTRRMTNEGIDKDFLTILYAGNDKVYVPVENLGLLDRYVGAEDAAPQLDRLGGRNWLAAKARAARASQEYAEELLRLHARRAAARATPFPADTDWQAELEAAFPFVETPDQLAALRAVKADMQSGRPMDRLICGDVGFGKTEIALRAAFKAATGLRQVAVLVPTTILCYQHYTTFKRRLEKYPLRVEMLSRFVSPARRQNILADLASGRVDIVVGTHLLLSPRVRFRDLGLVIVDEEQKFGVRQKERIRSLRAQASVLTLTATPIPRTLYMALAGLRDISPIHTPPPGRREISTEVTEWNDSLVREYIMRELGRGGQVFFVHNEIQTINEIAGRLQRLLPGVSLAVAHGQMSARRLADIYLGFAAGEFPVLLSTAIIESGLDMPNVNTIIVNRADRFGLADLHQLRGRVGRAQEQAYALFLIPARREITLDARKRLSAIVAYSRLGSGYKLALRDMEIRGVGNLLGTEQHGHVARIGFTLYTLMLRDAVAKLKGETVAPEPELSVDIPAFFPESYVADSYERVALYKRLLGVGSEDELAALRAELLDRFGRYPEVVENLFRIALIRVRARARGLLKVYLRHGKATLIHPDRTETHAADLARLLELLSSR
ncbi:MAG: transcription-repair coupling factor [candidate division WOR-3 bacterium]